MKIIGFDTPLEAKTVINALIYLAESGTMQHVAKLYHNLDTGLVRILEDQTFVQKMDVQQQQDTRTSEFAAGNLVAFIGGGAAFMITASAIGWTLYSKRCKQNSDISQVAMAVSPLCLNEGPSAQEDAHEAVAVWIPAHVSAQLPTPWGPVTKVSAHLQNGKQVLSRHQALAAFSHSARLLRSAIPHKQNDWVCDQYANADFYDSYSRGSVGGKTTWMQLKLSHNHIIVIGWSNVCNVQEWPNGRVQTHYQSDWMIPSLPCFLVWGKRYAQPMVAYVICAVIVISCCRPVFSW